ncbi:MAG: MarR family transcriptional regulator [bacterium]
MKEIPVREFRNILRQFERAVAARNQSACCCGVTVTQCHLLMELDKGDNITLNELADCVGLDKSTVSRTVETLVKNSLIDRTIPKNNRRTTLITLTKKGKAVCRTINTSNDAYFRKTLGQVPVVHRAGFLEGFETLTRAMESQNKAGKVKV